MKKPTLDEFISQGDEAWPKNSWIRESGFKSLYIRLSKRHLEGELRSVIDLANITASRPGSGTFTRLVARLRVQYPTLGIYIECVQQPRFSVMLVNRLGFKVNPLDGSSYYLLSD
jgi:deoxyribodipyrimidine photolyase-like uncharacterized protein